MVVAEHHFSDPTGGYIDYALSLVEDHPTGLLVIVMGVAIVKLWKMVITQGKAMNELRGVAQRAYTGDQTDLDRTVVERYNRRK